MSSRQIQTFFYAAATNLNGIKKLLADLLSTFLTKSYPFCGNDLKSLPKNPHFFFYFLSSTSSSLEFNSVNHYPIYENSE